jgi:hypothetical protein
LYSTYLGGSNHEYGQGMINGFSHKGQLIDIDRYDYIYVVGSTKSPDFPTTPGAFDTLFNGNGNNSITVFIMKWFFRPFHNISSVLLKKDNIPVSKVYSKLCTYTFNVNLVNTFSLTDTKMVRIILSPLNNNIQFQWNHSTSQFSKFNDPNNYVTLEQTSNAYNDSLSRWTIDFDVTYNWTYPDEDFHNVQVYATSKTLSPAWLNTTNVYHVENDLVFTGNLSVKGEDYRTIQENDLVCGGEQFNWSGLKVLYENTTDVYPPGDEYKVTIWDEDGYLGYGPSVVGENFSILTPISSETDTDGNTHIINISGIPPECDKTNESFTIRIDGDNVTFSNPMPEPDIWQTTTTTSIGVTITDIGGGKIKGSSVKYCYSTDNGTIWSDWKGISKLKSAVTLEPRDTIFLSEGRNNLFKWQAEDSVGNGPTQSPEYRILIDTENVIFSGGRPVTDHESPTEKVEIGITISDITSGVNASSIEYAISTDGGVEWSFWKRVPGLINGPEVSVTLNLTFPNGSTNRIKWRASDIAGNGPKESKAYSVNVNTWLQTLIPRVKLWSPLNGSVVPSRSVKLTWLLENRNLFGVTYDLYFDTFPPTKPNMTGLIEPNYKIINLTDGQTYYWTVIPKISEDIGHCTSGFWSFKVDVNVQYPTVKLLRPENGSIVSSIRPTLAWSVKYDDTEKLSYDVYLDTVKEPVNFEQSTNPYFLPSTLLQDNQTYYWKVVPKAGNVIGQESETWSFTVRKGYIPHFELEIKLEPWVVGIGPAGMKSAKAYVTNKGELTDSISLSIDVPQELHMGGIVNEPSILDTTTGMIAIFNITVTTTKDIEPDEILLTVTATSGRAAEYGITYEEKELLKVIILETKKPEPDKESDNNLIWIILIIVIIIILAFIVLLIIIRKKKSEEKLPIKDTVTIKPIEPQTPESVQGKTEAVKTEIQIPAKPTVDTSSQLTQSATPKPTLAVSPTVGQVPVEKQIQEVQQKPQLPPRNVEGSVNK